VFAQNYAIPHCDSPHYTHLQTAGAASVVTCYEGLTPSSRGQVQRPRLKFQAL